VRFSIQFFASATLSASCVILIIAARIALAESEKAARPRVLFLGVGNLDILFIFYF
jgi:hypothetical protein